MREEATVCLDDHVVCRETTNGLRMLFNRQKGVMYELNETASSVLGRLADSRSCRLGQLVDSLADEYEAPREAILADVWLLLVDLADAGLVAIREVEEQTT